MQKRVKMGGRQKGTPNKTTTRMKDTIERIINDQLIPTLPDDIKGLTPYERTKLLTALLRFYMPTILPQMDISGDTPPIIIIDKGI
jgi:hypothetical protein